MSDLAMVGRLVLQISLSIGAVVCLTWLFNKAARIVSHGLRLALNPLIVSQRKAVACGSDMQEALVPDDTEWPISLSCGYPYLPEWIAADLEQASTCAISEVIPKCRNVVESPTEVTSKRARADVLAGYLTWKVLIYTSYFDQDHFIKLVAHALGQSEGFKPPPAVTCDREYTLVSGAQATNTQGAMANELPIWQSNSGFQGIRCGSIGSTIQRHCTRQRQRSRLNRLFEMISSAVLLGSAESLARLAFPAGTASVTGDANVIPENHTSHGHRSWRITRSGRACRRRERR
jgi:hypothetical protein